MEKATLVLEGGATRGVFTAGALDYIMEKGMYLSHVIGVSAGSCNAVNYVSRQIGRTRDCMIHKEKELNYYYGIRKSIKEKSIMNMDMIFNTYPNDLIPFDYDTYFNSETDCRMVATNCITGKAEYMDERSDREKFMKICRASCSMPLACPMVNIDGVPYLDGGIADSIPIEKALETGNEKTVVILTRNAGYRKKRPAEPIVRLYRRAYKSYPRFVHTLIRRNYMYNQEIKRVKELEQAGRIFVLRPVLPTVSRLEKDTKVLTDFYNHGYQLMEKEYENLLKYLEK